MKRMVAFSAAVVLVLSLTACGPFGARQTTGTPAPQNSAEVQSDAAEQKIQGIINRIDEYLVLLTKDGEYHVMDLGEGVTLDGFAEGDSVDVTYTGKLGVESETPVITAIVKTNG